MLVSPNAPVLRVAAVWGTTIVGFALLEHGRDCRLGDGPGALAPLPDGVAAASTPLRAVSTGWELDARGALNGLLTLRGREESVVGIARSGATVPVLPGDYGLIQYGLFSICFQYTGAPQRIRGRLAFDPLVSLSLFSSLVLHLGMIGMLIVNWTPPEYHLPPELVPDFASQFHLNRALAEWEPATPAKEDTGAGGRGPKDPGARDARKQGGGQKISAKEGKAGANGKEQRAELQGEPKPTTSYGGLTEALADTGTDIKKTLSEIRTVADALGGLRSSDLVLGAGSGTGLRGAASGGGGTGAGVIFGSGTMSTGWGPGAGGGFGAGAGGAGGRGNAGFGGAGPGDGTGNGTGRGPGEHGVQGAPAAVSAQGGLNPEQIRRVVIAHRGALQACYEIEAQKDPTLKGGVTVSWTIDPTGAVTSATVAGSTLRNARVEGCVLRQVRAWHFPSSDGVSQATFPFSFGIGR
ncbi:MAG: AgmX/PglI C-terminal domain-containing protein [Myxococcota bacterium]|nr:AgmX/PglI C-terminal domain-containing protein [Myxococcota bacterium]